MPGRPRVVHTPGHTAGSCSLHLQDRDALFTGDALVTLDPYSRRTGPRQMMRPLNVDHARGRQSLERIADVPATTVLPGHGEPWTSGTAAAAARARTAA